MLTTAAISLLIVGLLIFLGLWASNYRKAGPDEALIVYGGALKYKAPLIDPETQQPKVGPTGKPLYIDSRSSSSVKGEVNG